MNTASSSRHSASSSRAGSVTPSVEGGGGKRVVRFGGRTERTRTVSVSSTAGEGARAESKEGQDDEGEDEIEEEETAETTMCVFSIKGRLAAAYLDATTYKLHIMEDVYDNEAFDIAEMVLEQVKPMHVLVNTSAEETLIDRIKAWSSGADCNLEIRPAKEFHYNKAKSRVLSLHLPPPSSLQRQTHPSASSNASGSTTSASAYDFQRRANQADDMDDDTRFRTAEMRLGGMLDWDKTFSISAAGSLLSHLSRAKARGELPGTDDGALSVNGIEISTPEAYMQINADTLSALQIFDEQSHAYMHSRARTEGLSLYTILNSTRTRTGKNLLKTWLQRPLLSIKDIAARHDAVQLFARQDNSVQVSVIGGLLKGMANISQVLGRMKRGMTRVRDWKSLLEFAARCAQMKDTTIDLIGPTAPMMIKKINTAFDTEALTTLGQEINNTIDWEESTAENRVVIKPGINAKLDEYKHMYAGLDTLLMTVADKLQQEVPADVVSTLNVTYFPQLGFLIAAEMTEPWNQDTQDDEVLEGWTFQFATEEIVYFKDQKMHDLDGHFGDLHSVLVDLEIEIAHKLSEVVLEQTEVLQDAVNMCDELDCLISFAEAAHQSNYRRPVVTEDNVIIIKNGRHALQELTIDHYVPNPTKLVGGRGIILNGMSDDENGDGDEDEPGQPKKEHAKTERDHWSDTDVGLDGEHSVMVLTGTNASGKSVYGKAVALIVYMAQIGSFVPCDAATIGLVDKMFTRLSTKESVAKGQSSFMIDLGQISYALRNATPRSLIIADEFGKGTISTDGAGLLAGVIMHLLNRGERCPKMIAMTHFHELFTQNFLPKSLPISFASMEIMIPPSKDRDALAQSITYLYRLVPHLSLTSHAAECARSQGLPGEIVDRAIEVGKLLSKFEFLPLQNRQMTEEDRADLLYSERVCRSFLSHDFGPVGAGGDVHSELRGILEMMDEDEMEEDGEESTATGE